MRILVDVTHPAHVHLFKNAISEFRKRGHTVSVVSREKDVTTELLDAYDIPHTVISQKGTGAIGVPMEWLSRELTLYRLAKQFDPDVILSRLNPAAAHVSYQLDVPNIVFHDNEVTRLLDRITIPFTTVACTPTAFTRDLGSKQRRYAGFHELAYLHPARFTPNPDLLERAGIIPDDPYAVVRLVEMTAHHDIGSEGLSSESVRRFAEEYTAIGNVYITSEAPLPPHLSDFEVPVEPESIHHLLAFADVYFGDSSTMATESAVLGTPAVRYDTLGADHGNFEVLAEYGLVDSLENPEQAVDRALALSTDEDAERVWNRRRSQLLAENIDVTAFMMEVVEEIGGS